MHSLEIGRNKNNSFLSPGEKMETKIISRGQRGGGKKKLPNGKVGAVLRVFSDYDANCA